MYKHRDRVILTPAIANLAAAAVYTSGTIRTEDVNHVRGKVFSDQTGTLALQQSDDGTTWDTLTTLTITASTAQKFDEICYTNFMRLVFTNTGASTQTTFRLSAYRDPF